MTFFAKYAVFSKTNAGFSTFPTALRWLRLRLLRLRLLKLLMLLIKDLMHINCNETGNKTIIIIINIIVQIDRTQQMQMAEPLFLLTGAVL